MLADDEVVPDDTYPTADAEVAPFVRAVLGLPGIVDVHVHLLPHRLQAAVWEFFDRLETPPWPIAYRQDEARRLVTLAELGVVRHTALAYGHRPGVAAWCNRHTLDAADEHPQVVPTFTFFPEDGVDEEVAAALARGGQVAKVHLQVGRFHATDPRLAGVWPQLVAARVPVVLHASAVYGVAGGAEYCGPDAVRALLDRHPDLRLVIAHLGAPDTRGFLDLADEAPQLRFDTAMVVTDPPYLGTLDGDELSRVAALAREGRVLFGSDFPSIPHAYAAQVRGLRALGLDVGALRRVLHDEAGALLAAAGTDPPWRRPDA